jgi:hypothetical protein
MVATSIDLVAIRTDATAYAAAFRALIAAQATLVSATNIKTINGVSVLGSGNLVVTGSGASWGTITGTLSDQLDLVAALAAKANDAAVLHTTGNESKAGNLDLTGVLTSNISIGVPNNPGVIVQATGDTFGRAALGLNSGAGFVAFGSGSGARDVTLSRTGTATASLVATNFVMSNTQYPLATAEFRQGTGDAITPGNTTSQALVFKDYTTGTARGSIQVNNSLAFVLTSGTTSSINLANGILLIANGGSTNKSQGGSFASRNASDTADAGITASTGVFSGNVSAPAFASGACAFQETVGTLSCRTSSSTGDAYFGNSSVAATARSVFIQQAGENRCTFGTNARVAIGPGNQSPARLFSTHLNGATATYGVLLVTGAATTPGQLIRAETNAGTEVFAVDAAGNVSATSFTGALSAANLTGLGAGWSSALAAAYAPGGGSVATDAIWDAVGDLAVGTGSDTAARLAMGTALQVLRVNAGATGLEWAPAAGGGDAFVANPLSQFAATTSAQLRGVISDETGSDKLVFSSQPIIDRPVLSPVTYATASAYLASSYTNALIPISDRANRLAYSDGSFLRWVSTGAKIAETPSHQISIVINTATTGDKNTNFRIPFACTITGWELVSNISGNLVLDIWKAAYASLPPVVGGTITGSAKPTLTAALKATSSTLTGWTTVLDLGDYLDINVDSTTVGTATLTLFVDRV